MESLIFHVNVPVEKCFRYDSLLQMKIDHIINWKDALGRI